MTKRIFATGLAILFLFLFVRIVDAQQPQPTPSDDQVNAIARQLYCPVCENTPLDVCPTPACAQWRDLIRQKLAEGKTDQEIKDYFVQQYGARVLGTPPPRGLNLLVYLVPLLAVAIGIFILYRVYRAWRQPLHEPITPESSSEPPPGQDASQDEYIHRLEEEIRKG